MRLLVRRLRYYLSIIAISLSGIQRGCHQLHCPELWGRKNGPGASGVLDLHGLKSGFLCSLQLAFAWQDDFFLGFFSDVPMVHHFGAIRMHIVLACQFIASSYEIAGSSLRGMGKSLTPAVLTVFGTCLLRIVWVYGVSPVWRRIRCADDGVSGVVGGYWIVGAYGLLVVYPEKEIGFELKRKRLSQILK